jgi:hypothetical protein
VIVGVRARSVDAFDRAALGQIALMLGLSLLPFLLGGAALAGVLGRARGRTSGVLLGAFLGLAEGLLVAPWVMPVGPARVGLGVAVVLALSGACFALLARRVEGERPASAGVVATFVLGTSVLLAGDIGAPYLKLAGLRWIALDRVDEQRWTERALFTLDKPQANQAWVRTDGTFGTAIVEAKQVPPQSPEELPYIVHRDRGPTLVVGAGGGREIKSALRQGQKEVFAVEAEPWIANAIMRGKSRAFSGELYDKPELHLSIESLRSHARRAGMKFRNIVVPGAETSAVMGFGAIAAEPAPLLTVEAFQDLLGLLLPEGTVVVTRPEGEIERLIALAVAGLRGVGERAPEANLFACSKDKLASLVVKRTALGKEELRALHGHCRRSRYAELYAPDGPREGVRKALADGADPGAQASTVDLRPPTDDRPFWYATVAPGKLLATLKDVGALKDTQRALLFLAMPLGLGVMLLLVALGVSASRGREAAAPRGVGGRAALSLAGFGAGATLIGRALLARLGMMVGRPEVVSSWLPALFFLALGLGCALGGRAERRGARMAAMRWGLALIFVLAPLLMGLAGLLDVAIGWDFRARVLVAAGLLGVVGAGMGACLSLSVAIASSWGGRVLCGALAVGALGAFVAMPLGTMTAMLAGHSAALLLGALLHFVGTALVPAAFVPAPSSAPVAPVEEEQAPAEEANAATESAEGPSIEVESTEAG